MRFEGEIDCGWMVRVLVVLKCVITVQGHRVEIQAFMCMISFWDGGKEYIES